MSKTATVSREQQKTSTAKEHEVKWFIPFPATQILELEPPKTRKSSTTVEDPDGKRTDVPDKEKSSALTAKMRLDFKDQNQSLKLLGLEQSPKGPVLGEIILDATGDLRLKLQSTYSAPTQWTEKVSCGGTYHSAGQRYPYGPEEPGYYETYYRDEVRYGVEDRTERVDKVLKGAAFAHLYLALMNAAPEMFVDSLLKYIERYCGEEVKKAKESLLKENRKLFLEAKAALERQLEDLAQTRLPH